MSLSSEGKKIEGAIEYSTDLYDAETVRRMVEHYRSLLDTMVKDPDQLVSTAPMLTEAERRRILVEWNDTRREYPQACVHQLFEEQAALRPDAVAVIYQDQQLTYGELNRQANRLAHRLRDLGVRPEVLVGLCMERSLEMIVGLLGILKAGGAYVPLDPGYPRERLAFMAQDTGIRVVLSESRLAGFVPSEREEVVCLDTWKDTDRDEHEENLVCDSTSDNLAYVIYTSGSTGEPKGVEITHRGIVRLLFGVDYASFDAEQVWLHLAPISFDASTLEIWGALLHGARCVLFPERIPNAPQLREVIRKQCVNAMWLTASLFNAILDEAPDVLLPIDQLLVGGEALSIAHVRRARKVLPATRLINGYGPTEGTTFTCCYSIPKEIGESISSIPIGRPIGNTRVYILDHRLEPVPVGVAGELYIGGDGLARGYLNRPELTAEKFIAHPFSSEPGARIYRTGDLARYRPDGNIEFLGRMDHQVKIRGFRIELEEIEIALQQHADVSQCVAAAPEDAAGEKRLVAYVVPANPDRAPAISGLRDFLKQKLPDYMVPAAFVMLPNLPLTPNGKIDRKALPEPGRSQDGLERQLVEPRTPMEMQLAQIWKRILNVTGVSVHDNFFELGGHSLLAVRLISEIHNSLHRSLPLLVFFKNPTFEAMAKVLHASDYARAEPQLITLQPSGSPGTLFFLDAGIGLCQLAELLNDGPASFGTIIPLTPAALRPASHRKASELPSLEELAAAHVALIRTHLPLGPCVLAGHSLGGLIAFEVAHQLQREGRQVELILLLDSWAKAPQWWKKLKLLTPSGAWNSLNFRTRHLAERSRARLKYEAARLTSTFNLHKSPNPEVENFDQLSCDVRWKRGNWQKVYRHVWRNYRPCQLDCRAVLFRSQRGGLTRLHAIDDKLGWGGLFARGLEIVDSPGDHMSLLAAPHLHTLAQQIQEHLGRIGHVPEGGSGD